VIAVNEAPVIADQLIRVPENATVGALFGPTIVFSDPDNEGRFDGDEIPQQSHVVTVDAVLSGSFSLGGDPFSVDQGTSRLRLGRALDFEATDGEEHSIRLKVTDSQGLSATATITIEVLNTNEKPLVT